jgi:hypothetical protein
MIDPTHNPHEDDHHIEGSSAHETAGGLVIKHGDAFLIVDRLGEIHSSGRGEQGLFYRGTRYISKLRFRFGKRSPMLLCSSVLENNLLLAVDLANPDMPVGGGRIPHGTIHVSRRALLEGGVYVERITILNYGASPVHFPLRIEFDADFCDIFEVRGARRPRRGEVLPPQIGDSSLLLAYEGLDRRTRSTEITFSERPASIDGGHVVFDLSLDPHAALSMDMRVTCGLGSAVTHPPIEFEAAMRRAEAALRDEESDRTIVHTSNPHFNRWLARSRADLRMLATQTPHGLYPYAGVFARPAVVGATYVDGRLYARSVRGRLRVVLAFKLVEDLFDQLRINVCHGEVDDNLVFVNLHRDAPDVAGNVAQKCLHEVEDNDVLPVDNLIHQSPVFPGASTTHRGWPATTRSQNRDQLPLGARTTGSRRGHHRDKVSEPLTRSAPARQTSWSATADTANPDTLPDKIN